MGFVTDAVLFGVDCCFLSNVFVLDPEFCHALIWSVIEFLPPSLCDGMTDPCRTRRDSGCFDLIHQDIEIKFIITYILRTNYIDIIACIGTLYLRTLRRSYLRKR